MFFGNCKRLTLFEKDGNFKLENCNRNQNESNLFCKKKECKSGETIKKACNVFCQQKCEAAEWQDVVV